MRCPDEETLLRYLGPAGPGPHAADLEAHFDGCPTCRAVIATLARSSLVESTRGGDGADEGWVSDHLPVGVRIGRYVVQGRIGAGAMGVVYDAIDPELQRPVAIKRLRAAAAGDADRQARLLREAQSLARLSHPNVVAVYDAGVHDGHPFLAMARVHGTTLRAWLEAQRRDRAAIVAAMAEVAAGAAAIHGAGLVHRDLKPDNVLVTDDGRVLVTDFGLVALGLAASPPLLASQETSSGERPVHAAIDSALTQTGQFVGTPRYMAPEQLVGGEVGPAADQFALCVMAFEALTGRHPFAADTPEQLLQAIRRRNVDPAIESLPRPLQAALRRGLHPDSHQRHASTAELATRLRARDRRSRTGLVIVGAGAIAAAVGLWWSVPTTPPSAEVEHEVPAAVVDAGVAALGEGERLADAGAFVDAASVLQRAHDDAVAAGAWSVATDAATQLVVVVGVQGEDLAGGLRWHRHAESALHRLGDDPGRAAELADARGMVVLAAGDWEPSRVQLEAAERMAIAAFGEGSSRAAIVSSHLATALTHLGRLELAVPRHQAAIAALADDAFRVERARALVGLANAQSAGDDMTAARATLEQARSLLSGTDPLLGQVANNLAIVLTRAGEYDAAAAELDVAEASIGRVYGADHPNVAGVITGRANLRAIAGDFVGAREAFEKALAIKERAFGVDHPSLLPIIANLAQVARITRDRESCKRHELRAVQLARVKYGADHLQLAEALEDLGNTLATGDTPKDAMPVLEEALAIRRTHVGADDPSLASNWLAQAKVHIEAEDWTATDAALDRAEALAPTPEHRAAIELTRAESLWRRGDEHLAIRLAEAARARLVGRPDQMGLLANVEGWIAAH